MPKSSIDMLKSLCLVLEHDGVITHLEPDVLECEVKWALESITTNKVSGAKLMEFQLSYSKS